MVVAAVGLLVSCFVSKSGGRGLSAKSVLEHIGLQHGRMELSDFEAQGVPREEGVEYSQVAIRYRDTVASFLGPHSSAKLRQEQRRMGTMSGGDLSCMSLEFEIVETVEEEVEEDECADNFQGKTGEPFCNDPYFGGVLGCCYNNDVCYKCAERGNCTEISLQCSSRSPCTPLVESCVEFRPESPNQILNPSLHMFVMQSSSPDLTLCCDVQIRARMFAVLS